MNHDIPKQTFVQHRLYEDDKKERYFYIYYNPAKQAAEREQFEQKVEKFQQFLESRRNTADKFGKTHQHYFHLHYDKKGTFLGANERCYSCGIITCPIMAYPCPESLLSVPRPAGMRRIVSSACIPLPLKGRIFFSIPSAG